MVTELLGNLCLLKNIQKGLCHPYNGEAGPEEPASGEARTPPPPPWLLQGLVKPGSGGAFSEPSWGHSYLTGEHR